LPLTRPDFVPSPSSSLSILRDRPATARPLPGPRRLKIACFQAAVPSRYLSSRRSSKWVLLAIVPDRGQNVGSQRRRSRSDKSPGSDRPNRLSRNMPAARRGRRVPEELVSRSERAGSWASSCCPPSIDNAQQMVCQRDDLGGLVGIIQSCRRVNIEGPRCLGLPDGGQFLVKKMRPYRSGLHQLLPWNWRNTSPKPPKVKKAVCYRPAIIRTRR
jgi:hypothetical protein